MKSSQDSSPSHSEINVNVSDFVLTPLSCGVLINEIFKSLLYQKSQIPYTYNWLKNVVEKKRSQTEQQSGDRKINFTVQNHFKTVSSTYDTLEKLMKYILNVFRTCTDLKEIVFIFGVTPVCPKEVFTIRVGSLEMGHSEDYHVSETSRKHHKALQKIFLSSTWMDSIDSSLSCTNLYVFMKKTVQFDVSEECGDDIFIPCKPLTLLSNVKHVIINLNSDKDKDFLCCHNLRVYNECVTPTVQKPRKLSVDNHNAECHNDSGDMWFQSTVLIKGFKDVFVNKISACQLW